MTMQSAIEGGQAPPPFGPWNPGIQSHVPMAIRGLSTIFRSDNAFTSLEDAVELQGLTGFALAELVAFRPQRLALHELLIRVTADFAVPDGMRIEDLGINFRQIARRMLARCIAPNMPALVDIYDRTRTSLQAAMGAALDEVVPALAAPAAAGVRPRTPGLFRRFAAQRRPAMTSADGKWGPAEIAQFELMASAAPEALHGVACRTLARVLSALFTTHGHAWGSRQLIVTLSTELAANTQCSEAIGRALEPWLWAAASSEGCRLLPRQPSPVVINTKGPSASGKSSLRPLQRKLAGDIGANWEDFALISPDIWRKQLLDYGALGTAYKYAGAFTAEEVQIIDQKLDRHMANKHRRGEMTHLLIDRFRFDSFAPDSDEAGSNLLTRFGQTLYLFFVITPPEQLVERAWNRGLEFGRYKAVDDTLAHAVEAYSGIPEMFLTWVRRGDKRLRFEFLDNTVPLGDRPRTVAFGSNETCNLLDLASMLNIERFARVNVNAAGPASLYPEPRRLRGEDNTAFLKQCVGAFTDVNFVEQSSGRIYLRLSGGVAVWKDPAALDAALRDPDARAGIDAVARLAALEGAPVAGRAQYLASAGTETPTLGRWG